MARQVTVGASKPDKTRQVIEVRPEQDAALMVLLRGGSDEEAGRAAGVCRQTVSTWLNSDPAFVAELNRRRAQVWSGYQDHLRALVVEALDVLGGQLKSTDPGVQRQVASIILKTVGDQLTPTGKTDPEAIDLAWANEKPGALAWMGVGL